jgi:hypothetical protein
MAPLDLIHSNSCEMNGRLKDEGRGISLTFIDDASRFCHIYLLKSKDKALHYFKIYKARVENQL